jgi:hypothetical protein
MTCEENQKRGGEGVEARVQDLLEAADKDHLKE